MVVSILIKNNIKNKMLNICINLKSRGDRRTHMKKQSRKWGIPLKFYRPDKDTDNPERGCRTSHVEVLKQYIETGDGSGVCVLEDDAVFTQKVPVPHVNQLPPNYDIVYLGGTETIPLKSYDTLFNIANGIYSTHAYIISKKMAMILASELDHTTLPIDEYLVQFIQPKYNCYIFKTHITHQSTQLYSDIQNRVVDYTQIHYPMVSHDISSRGDFHLKLNENIQLPNVISVITPTRNRHVFLPLMIENIKKQKGVTIEWIVINAGESIQINNIASKIINVPYDTCIAKMRNIGVMNSSSNVIVHMDDDDIYHEYSVLSRVHGMLSNEADCIGCPILNCMNLQTKSSFTIGHSKATLMEASMAYTRSFWDKCQFDERVLKGEGLLFLRNRKEKIVQIPSMFVMTAITHNTNITGDMRSNTDTANDITTVLYDELPDKTKSIIDLIRTSIYH
jgi:hypothetical protein